jgi:hypothetical protein
MKSSNPKESLVDLLGKEFWGILTFEMSLPSLYELLKGDKMGIGLKRLGDWVVFPNKIPIDHQQKFYSVLNKRREHPDYDTFVTKSLSPSEEHMHFLVLELLRLKYTSTCVTSSSFREIFKLPMDVFYAISIQMIEMKYIRSQKLMDLYHHYKESKGEGYEE